MLIFMIPVVGVIVLVAFFIAEEHANQKRRRRGEEPMPHGDLTDAPPPVNVIDWTRK